MSQAVAYFNNDRDRYVDKKTVETVSKELSHIITKQIREGMRESKKAY